MIRTRSRMLLVVLVFGSAACSREAPTTPSVSDSGSVSHGNVGLTQHIDSITPTTILTGSGDTRVTISGSGFEPGKDFGRGHSFVVLGDDDLSTTWVNSTQLTAVIPAKSLETPITSELFVVYGYEVLWSHGYRGDPRSNSVTFTIDPRLNVSSITPTTALAGSGDTVVTIDGSGFTSWPPNGPPQYSFAVWGDDELLTRFVNSSQLTAVIPAKFLTTPTTAQLFVVNGDGMGWSDGYKGYPRSNVVTFAITAP